MGRDSALVPGRTAGNECRQPAARGWGELGEESLCGGVVVLTAAMTAVVPWAEDTVLSICCLADFPSTL